MATKKSQGRPADHDEPLQPESSEVEFSFVDELDNVLGEQDGEPTIKVYRVGKPGEQDAFLYSASTAPEVDEAVIAGKWGGGVYRVKLWVKGVRGFLRNYRITIAGSPKEPPAEVVPLPAVASSSSAGLENALGLMAKMQAEGIEAIGRLVARAVDRDPLAERRATFEELRTMRDLFAPAAGSNAPEREAPNPIESARAVVQLAKELLPAGGAGLEDGEPSLLGLADRYLPRILEAVEAMRQGTPRPPLPPPGARVPAIAAVPPGAPGNVIPAAFRSGNPLVIAPAVTSFGESMVGLEQVPAPFRQVVRGVLDGLARAAEGNEPHDAVAADLLGYQSYVAPEIVDQALERPDWFRVLCELEPRLAAHRAYLTELKLRLERVLYSEADLTAGEDAGTTATDGAAAA